MAGRQTYNASILNNGGVVVSQKGSIWYDKKSKCYVVCWYHAPLKRTIKIRNYMGDKRILFRKGKQGRELAERMLSQMRGDDERGVFRLEKYTLRASDVVPYLETWVEAVKGTLAPATYKDYKGSVRNWLKPFFEARNVQLHEIQYDTIMELMAFINRTGKGKLNVVSCLHACLDYAWRSNRLAHMPRFPKKRDYQIIQKPIIWVPEARQSKILDAIPIEDQPIFRFITLHLRRPGEAMALRKEDYVDGVFTIRHGISNYQEIDRPKDKKHHEVPIVSDFEPWLAVEREKQKSRGIISPYLFASLRGRLKGQRYTEATMERIWAAACEKVGESIDMYRGTKTSRASSLLNEYGLSESELQMAGDWATLESVKKYAKTEVATRKNLLEGKVTALRNVSELFGTNDSDGTT